MAGGPGSGKGHVIETCLKPLVMSSFAHLDLDNNRTFLPEWNEDNRHPKSEETVSRTQVEAGFINELAAVTCCLEGRSFVYDSTLRNRSWNEQFMKDLKQYAQDVGIRLRIGIALVDTDLTECQKRVQARADKTDRAVPADIVAQVNTAAKETAFAMKGSKGIIDVWVHVDNNGSLPVIREDGSTLEALKLFVAPMSRDAAMELHAWPPRQNAEAF